MDGKKTKGVMVSRGGPETVGGGGGGRSFGKQQVALETNLDGVLLLRLYEKWIASIPVRCVLIGSPLNRSKKLNKKTPKQKEGKTKKKKTTVKFASQNMHT